MAKVQSVSVYQDAKGEYRFRALAGNHQVIAVSGEGFINRAWAIAMAKDLFPDADLNVEGEGPEAA